MNNNNKQLKNNSNKENRDKNKSNNNKNKNQQLFINFKSYVKTKAEKERNE